MPQRQTKITLLPFTSKITMVLDQRANQGAFGVKKALYDENEI
jgi:hypothetical protein